MLQTLLTLYLEFGEQRFLDPVPKALAWAKRSTLPDGRMARFYELKTNRPLYFTKDYTLTYNDSDMPTHYAFKVGNPTERIERAYQQILTDGRQAVLAERGQRVPVDAARIEEIIGALDTQGRWAETGRLKHPENRREYMDADLISCRTFNRNLTLLAQYVGAQK